MHILILGASGQIGTIVMQELARTFPGSMITGTSRSGKSQLPYTGTNIRMQAFDPFEDDWRELGQVDVVVNCIGQIVEQASAPFSQVHTGVTRQILRNRSRLGSPRIIQVSALGAGEYPKVPFLSTKQEADQLLLETPDTYVLRPSIVCTPDTVLVRKIRQLGNIGHKLGGTILVPRGFIQSTIQPVMGSDVAATICCIISQSNTNRVLEVVGPKALSFGELLQLFGHCNGHPVRAMQFPRPLAAFAVRYLIAPIAPQIINRDQFSLLFEDNIADVKPLANLLGRMPADTWPFWQTQFSS